MPEEEDSKKKGEQQNYDELIRDVLERLQMSFRKVDEQINFQELNPRYLAQLLNSKSRLAQAIFYAVSMIRDPKLNLNDSGRMMDLARVIKMRVLAQKEVKSLEEREEDKSV